MKPARTYPPLDALSRRPLTSRAAFLKLGLATALLPLLGGCSPAPMQVSQSSKDPSSPTAPDGVSPMVHATAAAPDAGADALVYACPMHPDVTSTKAGELCPKCNMQLVPRK